MTEQKLSYEYIRGLVGGEGCFTFCSVKFKNKGGETVRFILPAFTLAMNERDKDLLILISEDIGIKK